MTFEVHTVGGGGFVDYVRLGKLVRARRKELKLTQEKMAEKMNVSVSFYGNIERGTKVLSVETLYRLCVVLDVSADYLMGI
jgi:transcriptional regulator with XRE-family HTH domain